MNWGNLTILDVSKPQQPVNLGSYPTPGLGGKPVINGNYVYYIVNNSLFILDATDPAHHFETGSFQSTTDRLNQLVISSGAAFMVDGNKDLLIVDISDSANPVEIGIYNHPPEEVFTFAIQGKYLYLPMVGDWCTWLRISTAFMGYVDYRIMAIC